MNNRRDFITLLGGAAAWPLAARAQQADRARRIGVLMNSTATDATWQSYHAAFVQGLRQLGWIEGQNLRIDTRWSAGDAALARIYAAQLIGLTPDVIPGLFHDQPHGHSTSHEHGADRVHSGLRSRRA